MTYVTDHKETLDKLSGDLKDLIFDTFLSKVTPLVFADMTRYYGLTSDEINDAMERVGEFGLDDPRLTVQDKLIEQEFVNSQVYYLNKLTSRALADL